MCRKGSISWKPAEAWWPPWKFHLLTWHSLKICFYWTFSEQNTANLIKLDVSEINLKPLFEDNVGMECGQLKLPTSLAKNWCWSPPPSLGEARAPGLALGKPSGYTLLAPFLVTHRATPTIHHGACFEASCHWTLLYQMGSIKGSARKLFARHSVPRLDFTPACFPFFQVGIFQSVRAFSWHASWAF